MKVKERRREMAALLAASKEAITGDMLAARFHVSRQIIVKDIAALKAQGFEIYPTHYGYLLKKSPLAERVFRVKHTADQTEEELSSIIDAGGTVVDVFVNHRIYGKIAAPLHVFSKDHIKQFIENVREGKSSELMNITDGYHYHTVRAEAEEILDKIEQTLSQKGFLASENEQ